MSSRPTHSPAESSDGSLLRVLQAGDPVAAEELYRRYARRVLSVVRANLGRAVGQRIDADDIAQSVFRRFFTAAKSGQYDLPSGEELWDLLLVFTLNRVRNAERFHRAGCRDVRLTTTWGHEDIPASDPDPAADELADGVRAAIAELPEANRTVVELRMAGHVIEDIAVATGRSRRSVERLLQDTRTRLRAALPTEFLTSLRDAADR